MVMSFLEKVMTSQAIPFVRKQKVMTFGNLCFRCEKNCFEKLGKATWKIECARLSEMVMSFQTQGAEDKKYRNNKTHSVVKLTTKLLVFRNRLFKFRRNLLPVDHQHFHSVSSFIKSKEPLSFDSHACSYKFQSFHFLTCIIATWPCGTTRRFCFDRNTAIETALPI